MLKRKMYDYLLKWKSSSSKVPLVIKGLRQIGKTYIVKQFAEEQYKNVIYLDFRKDRNLNKIFDDSFEVDDLITQISVYIKDAKFIPGETVLIFDEVQDCPNARSSLKYFSLDGRFDVICTGSLLGIKGYSKKSDHAIPVGYEQVITMKPLDFEEFLWANGIDQNTVLYLKDCLNEKKAILPGIHLKMLDLFKKYICVGGMPSAVLAFLETHNMNDVYNIQKRILSSYTHDFGRHLEENGTLSTNNIELSRILATFNSIPSQLAKENKKFQYSKIDFNSKNLEYRNALEWLCDAGIVDLCYNLSITELPLEGNKIANVFKVYMQDTGLFVSMLDYGTQGDILNGNLKIYKGAMFENIVADAFSKMGRKLYYFHKNSGLEIDFVTRYKGKCTLIEVKATGGKTKSLKTILDNFEKYHIDNAIKLCENNISINGNILNIPYYLAFLLTEY